MDNHTLLTILVALIGVSVLIQVIVMIGAAVAIVALRKAITSAVDTVGDLKGTIVPMVHQTRQLVERISPQVASITADISEIAKAVRTETVEVKDSAHEVMLKVNKQTVRLDQMLTSGLDGIERAGSAIESAVSAPVRQANGIFAAVKAVVETYLSVKPNTYARRSSSSGSASAMSQLYSHSSNSAEVAEDIKRAEAEDKDYAI